MMEGEAAPKVTLTSEEMLVVFRYQGSAPGDSGLGGSSNDTGVPAPFVPLAGHHRWDASIANITITVFASVVIFCTVAGNALVITAVIKERRLRKVSNSFVINLAVSDILVGVLVTPIALAYQLHGEWIFSKLLCEFWISVDVTCCTASITNLCAISYDRYNAITEPLRYARKRTLKRACLLILVVWLYSLAIAVPPLLGWRSDDDGQDMKECKISQDVGYTFFSTVGAFYLPLLFMVFAYICIYRETSKRTRQWRRGPGSSKMISERDSELEAYNIRMMNLAEEAEHLELKLAQPKLPLDPAVVNTPPASDGVAGTSAGSGATARRGSGSGVFLRNSSLVVRRSIPYESAIVEVDENTRKEGSSSSGSSTNNATPSTFQTTVISHRPPSPTDSSHHNNNNNNGEGEGQDSKNNNHRNSNNTNGGRPARRSYGQFPRKLIRQISNLPSSDSSTATSSSSANTTSSSDLPPDQSPGERRFSSVLVRQNTLASLGDRKESLVRALQETAAGCNVGEGRGVGGVVWRGNCRPHESTRKSVTFLTPPLRSSSKDGGSSNGCSDDMMMDPSPTDPSDYNDILSGPSCKSQDGGGGTNRVGVGCGGGGGSGGGGAGGGTGISDNKCVDSLHHHHNHLHHHHHHHHHAKRRKRISVSQEKRAARTLSIVMGCFIVCWLPFFVVALMEPLCGHCHFHPTLVGVVLWLGYCNSALNPIIYTFFNKDFRFAFRKILRCTPRGVPNPFRPAVL